MKKVFLFSFIFIAGACTAPAASNAPLKVEPMSSAIDTFEKCVAAGYPVAKTYPAKCSTPDGKTFWGKR